MKRILKIVGILVAIIAFIITAGATYISVRGIPTYEAHPPDLKVEGDSAMIAEGKRMATLVCHNCHMSKNGLLEGKYMEDMPPEFGKAWSANITQDDKYGTGRYTDGELAYLLRTGVKRDGSYAPPWMVKFPHLSDYDLNSIIAYLRSEQPELKPVHKQQQACEPTFFAKFLCYVAFKPLPFPEHPVPSPDPTDKVTFGKYIATAKLDCFGCHSPSFEVQNIMEPEKTPGYFSGGNAMPNLSGEIIYTRNLTPDKKTGIGNYTEEQFIKAMKFGMRDNKPSLRYPMPPYAIVTDEEASAVWAYLQTIPAIEHDVDALYAKK